MIIVFHQLTNTGSLSARVIYCYRPAGAWLQTTPKGPTV
jgi:hypothetical protein